MITSPYNFVPLTNNVFYPSWGKQVQHDLPFSDGITGKISLTIEAKRPIYIRNSAPKPELEHFFGNAYKSSSDASKKSFDDWISFARLTEDGPFVIPGSTVKGMIRNVIKIAAFGSFRDAASTERYAVRDISLNGYQKEFVAGSKHNKISFLSKGGWLMIENNRWVLYESSYQRVEHECLADLSNTFRKSDFTATKDNSDSVSAKYRLWENSGKSLDICYTRGTVKNQAARHPRSKRGEITYLPLVYGLASNLGKQGADIGRLVFTGQPSPNKHMEFIFELPSVCTTIDRRIILSSEQVQRFLFVHEDCESESWKHWKPLLERGEAVPVFWLADASGGVKNFGLAQMFRLPARRTLKDGIPASHFSEEHDLADLMFGSIQGDALRGRVSVDSFTCEGNPIPLEIIWTILGGPKPTFYPNYLEQITSPDGRELKVIRPGNPAKKLREEREPFSTLMSDRIRLRGWKRYATRSDWQMADRDVIPSGHRVTEVPETFNSLTAFAPLPAGVRFAGTLRFHNLRIVEFGALVWALEWGGKDLRHNIGMAKGMGLGSVKISITDFDVAHVTNSGESISKESAVEQFIASMKAFDPNWENSDSIGELLLLANPRACSSPNILRYPKLEIGKINEFIDAKKNHLVLPTYGQMVKMRDRLVPYIESGGQEIFGDVNILTESLGPRKPAPGLKIRLGEVLQGTLVEGAKGRLRFRPDGDLGSEEGNVSNKGDARAGECWSAKVFSRSPGGNIFELIARISL